MQRAVFLRWQRDCPVPWGSPRPDLGLRIRGYGRIQGSGFKVAGSQPLLWYFAGCHLDDKTNNRAQSGRRSFHGMEQSCCRPEETTHCTTTHVGGVVGAEVSRSPIAKTSARHVGSPVLQMTASVAPRVRCQTAEDRAGATPDTVSRP